MKSGPLCPVPLKAGKGMPLAAPPILPVIDEAACSLGRLAASTCAACANACPRAALTSDDTGLNLDPNACSACGACTAACPQSAIRLGGRELPEVQGRKRVVAGLVCPRRGPSGLCLQGLGLRALAALWLQGTRQIVSLTADCTTCADGGGLDFAGRLAVLNQLLASRDLPAMIWHKVDELPRNLPLIGPQGNDVDPRRRAFLGGLVTSHPKDNSLVLLQAMANHDAACFAFAPQIDLTRCTGCDACVRVCPEAALSLIKDESEELVYQSASLQCSGCGMCADVCDSDALTVRLCHPETPNVALTSLTCRGCGVDVHMPTAGPWATGELCPICARTGHHKRLHQVLE